jgi:hypothetical protein
LNSSFMAPPFSRFQDKSLLGPPLKKLLHIFWSETEEFAHLHRPETRFLASGVLTHPGGRDAQPFRHFNQIQKCGRSLQGYWFV